ncbi:hypothetical protein [Photobacterium rosenbergii]|uniref:hypothetical protein n=1 Tax=Photobacterium rosenbergii TaxID=294936 RepID=UPI001C99C97E|nr:hypothetical protein [Photobacterium rosenbergii]MBY5944775.1 hypothetical protein [Photobacterium rosenbergii]
MSEFGFLLIIVFVASLVMSFFSVLAQLVRNNDNKPFTSSELGAMVIPLVSFVIFVGCWVYIDKTLYTTKFGDYTLFDWWMVRTCFGAAASYIFSATSINNIISKRRYDAVRAVSMQH